MAPVVGALFTGNVALVDGACTIAEGDDDDDDDEDDEDDDDDDEDDDVEELAGDVLGFNKGGELLAGPTITIPAD